MAGPQVTVSFTGDTRGLSQSVSGVQSALGGLSRAAGAIGQTVATGLAVAATAAAAVGASAVKAGYDYNVLGQRATAAFTTILGSAEAAEQMMAQVMAFADTSPFPRQAFVEATQQMLAFGFASEDVVPTLSAVQDAVAATGGTSQQLSEIVFVMSQIQASGKITGQDLMQLGQRGVNAAELIGSQMGMTGQQVREGITAGTLDAQAAMDALVAGMSASFGGAAAELKGTWIGAVDTLKARLRDLGSALVEPFIGFTGGGVAVEGVNAIASALNDLIDNVIPALAPLLDSMASRVSAAFDFVAGIISGISGEDIAGLIDTISGLGPAIASVGAGIATSFGGSLPIIGQFIGGLNPLVVAIGALIAASPELRSQFGSILTEVFGAIQPLLAPALALFEQLATAVLPVLATVFGTLVTAAAPLLELLMSIASDVLDVLGPAFESLGEALKPVIEALGAALMTVLQALAPVIPQIAEAFVSWVEACEPLLSALGPILTVVGELLAALAPLIGVIAGVLEWMSPIAPVVVGLTVAWWALNAAMAANPIGLVVIAIAALVAGLMWAYQNVDWFRAGVQFVWEWIKNNWPLLLAIMTGPIIGAVILIIRYWDQIKAAASAVWQAVTGFFAAIGQFLIGIFVGHLQAMWSVVQFIWNAMSAAASAVASAVMGFFTGVANWFRGTFVSLITGAVSTVQAVWNGLVSTANSVVSWITSAFNAIISWFVALPGRITSAVSGVYNAIIGPFKRAYEWLTGLPDRIGSIIDRIPGAGAISDIAGSLNPFSAMAPIGPTAPVSAYMPRGGGFANLAARTAATGGRGAVLLTSPTYTLNVYPRRASTDDVRAGFRRLEAQGA